MGSYKVMTRFAIVMLLIAFILAVMSCDPYPLPVDPATREVVRAQYGLTVIAYEDTIRGVTCYGYTAHASSLSCVKTR